MSTSFQNEVALLEQYHKERFVKANSSRRSRIAFDRTGDHIPGLERGIYTVNPDGSDCRFIRPKGRSPRWSPDGQWLAFLEETDDNTWLSSLFVMRPDGQQARRITHHRDLTVTPPTWSPDSCRLTYSLWLWQDKLHQVCIADIQTCKTWRLTHKHDNSNPVWMPSNEIVFSKGTDSRRRSRLFVMSPDGSNQRECALFAAIDREPAWSADGRRILCRRGERFCVINSDGSQPRPVKTGGSVPRAVLSPDGETVAYSSCDDSGRSGFEVFVVRVNGSGRRKLIANPRHCDKAVDSQDLSWSPFF